MFGYISVSENISALSLFPVLVVSLVRYWHETRQTQDIFLPDDV